MIELVIVVAVTILLTSLLFPAIATVRENLNRVLCASNSRQFGLAITMYVKDHKNRLPDSYRLRRGVSVNQLRTARLESDGWDGLGQLYRLGYCDAPECYYCPSHEGVNVLKREQWESQRHTDISTDYAYSGHAHWDEPGRPRKLQEGYRLILAVDALPTTDDRNHKGLGMNTLRGDGSVRWHEQTVQDVAALMAATTAKGAKDGVWRALERQLQ